MYETHLQAVVLLGQFEAAEVYISAFSCDIITGFVTPSELRLTGPQIPDSKSIVVALEAYRILQ